MSVMFFECVIYLVPGLMSKAEGGEYGNALQAALEFGHEEMVQMLLAARAVFWLIPSAQLLTSILRRDGIHLVDSLPSN